MVVGEKCNGASWGSDVVLLVEATANLFPYVESIKTNYIVPTLEFFNGAPADDRDFGYDSISNCSYTLLAFTAADSAPEPACVTVTPPTSSIGKVLAAFDKLLFGGGAAEQCSHIGEALATALQVFDDLTACKGPPSKEGSRHCILVCNSPPYQLPVLETVGFQGQTLEQLAAKMGERAIQLSIVCPRKIPQLCKLFEKAGGDLMGTLAKNYAKDKRHLVLPSGFTLAERPVTPPPETRLAPASPRSPAPGQKRSAPPGSSPPRETKIFKQPGNVPSPVGAQGPQPVGPPGTNVQRGQAPTPPISMVQMNQPNPPNVNIRQFNADVRSPGGGRLPPGAPVGPVGPGGVGPSHWNNASPPVSTPSPSGPTGNMSLLQSQLSTAPMRPQSAPAQGQFPQFRPRMVGPGGPMPGPGQPGNQGSPGVQYSHQQQQMMNQGPQSGMIGPGPGAPIMNQGNVPPNQVNPNQGPMGNQNPNMMGANQGGIAGPGPMPGSQSAPVQRSIIWRGDIEYHDRVSNPQQRVQYKLSCVIASQVNQATKQPEVNAGTWPDKMQLQLLPRVLLMNVMPNIKNAARCVYLNFQAQDPSQPGNPQLGSEQALQNLCRLMSQNAYLGFIHLTPPCEIKVMIVVYMADSNTFIALIANEQEMLLNSIKQVFEHHKKAQQQQQQHQQQQQQQQKNKMLMQGQQGPTGHAMPGGPQGPPMANMGQQGPPMTMGQQMGQQMGGQHEGQRPGIMHQGPMGPMGVPGQVGGPMGRQIGMAGGPHQPTHMAQRQMGIPSQGGMANPQQQNVAMNAQALGQPGGPMSGPMGVGGPGPHMMGGNVSQGGMLGPGPGGPGGPPGPGPGPGGPGQPGADFASMDERKQNLIKIQQLQQTLEAAQQKELQYKQQQMPGQGPVGAVAGLGGMMAPQVGPRPIGPGPQMRGMAPQGSQNPQLKHLLQHSVQAQQMRMQGPQGMMQPGQQGPQNPPQMYAQQNQNQYMPPGGYNQQF